MMQNDKIGIDNNSCRICLNHKKVLHPLFDNANVPTFKEMLINCANVKVFVGDGLPDKICSLCSKILKSAYKLKQTAEKSDALFQKYVKFHNTAPKKMSFNSINDIKSELDALNIKPKPQPEVEIEIIDQSVTSNYPIAETLNGNDIVICNTVIRKIEPHQPIDLDVKKENESEAEYLDEDYFQDDPHDEDYFPPKEDKKTEMAQKPEKTQFKIATLEDVRAFKKNIKSIRENKKRLILGRHTSSYITYYPLLENGEKGPPILLRRPNDRKVVSHGPFRRIKEISSKQATTSKRRDKEIAAKPREKDCCPVCGVLTFTITTHMLSHAEKKPFQCEYCPRSFVAKTIYEAHIKKHKGIKDHVCEICGAGFYSKKNVMRHKLTHNGERPFACTLCSKTFVLNHALKRHQGIHAGYKPFKCTMCAMSFNASHQLRNHMIMHTGERPYSCKICNVEFAYKVNLNNHVTRVHGINLRYKSIYTVTEEVIERESEAMNQANSLLTMALQTELQPVPEDHISTQIIFDNETTK